MLPGSLSDAEHCAEGTYLGLAPLIRSSPDAVPPYTQLNEGESEAE